MASSITRTGNSVSLDTFQNWRKENIFGYKTFKDSKGQTMVNFIWCKLCAKYEKEIMNSSSIRGSARTAARSSIELEMHNVQQMKFLHKCLNCPNFVTTG